MKKKPLIIVLSILALILALVAFLALDYKRPVCTASYEGDTVTFLLDYDTRLYQWWTVEYDSTLMTYVKDYTQESPNASLMGADMQHCFVFRANQPGNAFFTCVLWYIKAGDPVVYKTKSFLIITGPDGKISTYVTSID